MASLKQIIRNIIDSDLPSHEKIATIREAESLAGTNGIEDDRTPSKNAHDKFPKVGITKIPGFDEAMYSDKPASKIVQGASKGAAKLALGASTLPRRLANKLAPGLVDPVSSEDESTLKNLESEGGLESLGGAIADIGALNLAPYAIGKLLPKGTELSSLSKLASRSGVMGKAAAAGGDAAIQSAVLDTVKGKDAEDIKTNAGVSGVLGGTLSGAINTASKGGNALLEYSLKNASKSEVTPDIISKALRRLTEGKAFRLPSKDALVNESENTYKGLASHAKNTAKEVIPVSKKPIREAFDRATIPVQQSSRVNNRLGTSGPKTDLENIQPEFRNAVKREKNLISERLGRSSKTKIERLEDVPAKYTTSGEVPASVKDTSYNVFIDPATGKQTKRITDKFGNGKITVPVEGKAYAEDLTDYLLNTNTRDTSVLERGNYKFKDELKNILREADHKTSDITGIPPRLLSAIEKANSEGSVGTLINDLRNSIKGGAGKEFIGGSRVISGLDSTNPKPAYSLAALLSSVPVPLARNTVNLADKADEQLLPKLLKAIASGVGNY